MHLRRWYRYKDPYKTTNAPNGAHAEFIAQALQYESDDCLLWPFGVMVYGYGAANGRGAHNLICEKAHGPPPKDRRHALHSCDTPRCVNKRHLRWGNQADNMQDAVARGRTKKPWAVGKPRGTKKPIGCIPHINPPGS